MSKIRTNLESIAEEKMEELFERVPKAREFHAGHWIEHDYYRRHLVETVLRIRLNNEVDAYALYKIGARDNKLAAVLAQYLAEEYGHEGMFLRDIEHFGLTKSDVDAVAPFLATDELIGYLYLSIKRDGPLPTMIWNWFVEWYSERYNKVITQNAERIWGKEKVKGSMGHIQYDESHNHDDLMWAAVQRAIDDWGTVEKAENYLCEFVDLIARYFDQLHHATEMTADRKIA